MLLRPGLLPSSDAGVWSLELKWDGIRAQLRIACDGTWCLRSRPGRDCSDQFPELGCVAAEFAGRDVLLDGELVCLGAHGRPDFHMLRRRLSAGRTRSAVRLSADLPATLMVFDLLHLDGHGVRSLPYSTRRTLLTRELPRSGASWQTPPPLCGDLASVLTVTREHQLEGIVAKRLDAPYASGRRNGAWLKHKHRRRETFAVTGWRPAPATGRRLDAVFVARVRLRPLLAAFFLGRLVSYSIYVGAASAAHDSLSRLFEGGLFSPEAIITQLIGVAVLIAIIFIDRPVAIDKTRCWWAARRGRPAPPPIRNSAPQQVTSAGHKP